MEDLFLLTARGNLEEREIYIAEETKVLHIDSLVHVTDRNSPRDWRENYDYAGEA